MTNKLLASVVIPVWNDSESLMRCLDGIQGQSYPASGIQVIVVDNGSSPAIEIGDTHPFSIDVLQCNTPGSYAARNAGAAMAKGDVIAFTDADCVPEQDWLTEGIAALGQSDGRCIVGGEVRLLPPKPRTGVGLYQFAVGFQQDENIRLRYFSATANLFCYRSTFQRVGPFHEQLLSGGDREWAWRAQKSGFSIVFCKNAVVNTSPRTSLRAAIRQARRVAGGRRQLAKLSLTHIGIVGTQPHRTGYAALRWLLTRSRLTLLERIRALMAAIILHAAGKIEQARLHLGGRPERR